MASRRDVRPATREMVEAVVRAGVPQDAVAKARFFGAVPGGYAEGDVVLGVRVPVLRALARDRRRQVGLVEVEELLEDDVHEVRLLGAILLVELYKLGDDTRRAEVVDVVLRRAERLDNWDLVDTVAPFTLGPFLRDRPRERSVLDRLAASESLWRRRLAIVGTFGLIRAGEFDDTLRLAAKLLDDPHHLIHKATGWMLREVGARDRPALDGFLDRHAAEMPLVMLRYALEKHTPDERRNYLLVRSASTGRAGRSVGPVAIHTA